MSCVGKCYNRVVFQVNWRSDPEHGLGHLEARFKVSQEGQGQTSRGFRGQHHHVVGNTVAEHTSHLPGTHYKNCNVLSCIVLHCFVLFCVLLQCIVLYCIALYCSVLCCTAMYCTVFLAVHCYVLYCIVLYYIVLYSLMHTSFSSKQLSQVHYVFTIFLIQWNLICCF